MSLLDDARRLDCMCNADEGNHGSDCVLLLKPKIVAVLEAAERVLEWHGTEGEWSSALDVLEDALKGEEVKA